MPNGILLECSLTWSRDVVDTEPANGNVWKMLHGAINSLFDDDPADTGGSGMVSPPPQR